MHRLVPAPVAEAGSRGVEELLLELGGDVVMADAPERGSGAEQMCSALELMPVGSDRRKSAQSLGGRLADVLVAADSELVFKSYPRALVVCREEPDEPEISPDQEQPPWVVGRTRER